MSYSKTFYIVVNPVASKFAKILQKELNKRVTNRTFRVGTTRVDRANFVVTPRSLNKVEQMAAFTEHQVACPPYTTDPAKVGDLGTKTVFARTLVNSTGGKGIVEVRHPLAEPLVEAPLYTAYIPKKAEYRYHIFNGEVIDVQQKKRKSNYDGERDTKVRNLANGYVYCRDGIDPPDGAATLAINAVNALGYQYGAVDIIYNEKRNQSYVLEVNSRPGLMGTTLDKYVEAIITTYDLQRKV